MTDDDDMSEAIRSAFSDMNQFITAAEIMKKHFDAMIDAGFNPEQALVLTGNFQVQVLMNQASDDG